MGTVGISFGSPTSGNGFDVTSTVSSIVANLKAVETPWQNQLTSLKAQDSAFTTIGTDLAALSTSLGSLTDFEGVMASKLGSSSDTNILSLTSAGATASAGTHTVVVTQLAQTSTEYTAAIPSGDTLSGALTINGTTIPVVAGNSDTLSTYAAAINNAGVGVKASVISDTTGDRLSIVSNTSGLAGQITVTSGGTAPATTANGVTTPAQTYGTLADVNSKLAIGLVAGPAGQDAKVEVDNQLSLDEPSNTVTTAIPGVTFQLVSADPNTVVQVQIANDTSSIESAFSSFVSAYNTVAKDLTTQEGNDNSGNAEPLFGSPTLSLIQSSLSLALTSGAASGGISNLSQLGITVNQDGTLALNSTTLDAALNSNYSDVVGFLQNSGSFGSKMQNTLDALGNQSPSGAITLALQDQSTQETTLNHDISAQDALISEQQTRLTTELNTANQVLQSIPEQLNEINELYSAITGYSATNNG